MERGSFPSHEQLNLFDPALFTIRSVSNVLRPNFPNHFGEAEHDIFIDDLPSAAIFDFPDSADFTGFDPEEAA